MLKRIVPRFLGRTVKRCVQFPGWVGSNVSFAYRHRSLRSRFKILYGLTPPASLNNVGDQAQVIAIRAWFDRHFPELPVIEVDKNQSRNLIPALKWLIQPDDIIFLHSGGNLGDRGIWSETSRRLLISNFHGNQIVSLPQTIYFSNTPKGQAERAKSSSIYSQHPNLTVIGRDPQSGELAAQLFPKAKTFCMPDFVLSLPPRRSQPVNRSPKVLLCLRLDDESALKPEERTLIGQSLPYSCHYYDTTLDQPIAAAQRQEILNETLSLFLEHDIVVTDRYHGLIFTVLCQKPCVVLRTVDHKLTSAIHWFQDLPSVIFAERLDEVPQRVEQLLNLPPTAHKTINWNERYFDRIPHLVGLK